MNQRKNLRFTSSRFLWSATLAVSLLSAPLIGKEVKLQPVKDTTIYESEFGTDSNGSGIYFFAGVNGAQGGNRIMRALVAFDLTSIPQNSTIESVTLLLRQETPRNDLTQREVSLHRVLQDWGESTSDAEDGEAGGALAAEGDATWLHTFFSNTENRFWNNPGGDFEESPSASRPVGGRGFYQWSSEELAADVQSWVDDPSSNFGWLIRGQESLNGASNTAKRFTSRHDPAVNTRPELTVVYSETSGPEIVFPQFVAGGGDSTRWILRNNSSMPMAGSIQFFDANGESTQVSVDGGLTDRYNFSIDSWGSVDVSTDSTGNQKAGAAEVHIDSGSADHLDASEVFAVLGSFVSVTGARPEKQWQAYVSRDDSENSGIAVQNPDRSSVAVIKMVLLDSSGMEVATDELTLQAGQRVAQFLGEPLFFPEYFEQNPGPFQGTLNLEVSEGEDVALVGLIQKRSSGALIAIEATNNPFISTPQQ